jgi:hypothetical protein
MTAELSLHERYDATDIPVPLTYPELQADNSA